MYSILIVRLKILFKLSRVKVSARIRRAIPLDPERLFWAFFMGFKISRTA